MLRELPSLSLNLYYDTPVNHPPSELDTRWLRAWPGGWAKSDLSQVPFLIRCRRENGSLYDPPMETSFGHWNTSLSSHDENPIIGEICAGNLHIQFFRCLPNRDVISS